MIVEPMGSDQMWVVQYLRASGDTGIRLPAEHPRIYRVAAISGDTVWGVNVDTDVLMQVNRPARDGSGRTMNMRAYTTLEQARSAAVDITGQIEAEQAEHDRRTLEQAAAKQEEQQARFPALLPAEPTDPVSGVEVGITYSIGRTPERGSPPQRD